MVSSGVLFSWVQSCSLLCYLGECLLEIVHTGTWNEDTCTTSTVEPLIMDTLNKGHNRKTSL